MACTGSSLADSSDLANKSSKTSEGIVQGTRGTTTVTSTSLSGSSSFTTEDGTGSEDIAQRLSCSTAVNVSPLPETTDFTDDSVKAPEGSTLLCTALELVAREVSDSDAVEEVITFDDAAELVALSDDNRRRTALDDMSSLTAADAVDVNPSDDVAAKVTGSDFDSQVFAIETSG